MHTLTPTSSRKRIIFTALAVLLMYSSPPSNSYAATPPPTYLGSLACQPCHADEYRRFITYAKKSHSFESIERLRHGLTAKEIEGCYRCHTTGYGKRGGFVSLAATPQLKDAGCEVCHGPGSNHAATGDPSAIKSQLDKEDCEACHTSDRVAAFRFKPLIHGGAH